jgi:predicted extracellular nuclease
MRLRSLALSVVAVAMTALSSPMQEMVSAQSGTGIVISEFRFRGPSGGNDEFVELFNAGTAPVDISGWQIRGANNNTPPAVNTRVTINPGTIINPGCFFLAVNTNAGGFSGGVPFNQTYATGIADDGGVALTTTSTAVIIDQVGQGSNAAGFGEGQRLPMVNTNTNRGIERRPGGVQGHIDTNNNFADFTEIIPGTPKNSDVANCLTPGSIGITASVSPTALEPGQTLTVFGMVAPGTIPPSSGITVEGDLSAVGGSATTPLADNGVFPDLVANDRLFTTQHLLPNSQPLGAHQVSLTVRDAQGRSASQSASVTVNPPPVIYRPHEVQGAGAASPFPVGSSVIVRGVVTARKFNGFFLQTEAGMEDADPQTSEGLFVFVSGGAPLAVQAGRVVNVYGNIAEFVPSADPGSAPLTELSAVTAVVDLSDGPLPDPYVLTNAEVSAAGSLDQLERFEGMRVTVPSLTAITGTDGNKSEANASSTSNGVFYAVLTGQDRPFREPGVEAGYPVLPCVVGPCNIPVFDGNPERLRVDSDALEGTTAVNVSTGAVMTDVTGPLDFSFRTYTILPEATLTPAGGLTVVAAPAPAFNQFTIASFNMERFYDTVNGPGSDAVLTAAAYETRLAKASLTIRNVLRMPDIIGVQEVENFQTLMALADRIDTDAAAAGQPAPQYDPHLFEGNDQGGIDVGFLVKRAGAITSNVSVEQLGADATFVDPSDNSVDLLNDRPPVMLRATLLGPASTLPQPITVIVNHLRSLIDVELDDAIGQRVRAKRQAQAEWLANFIQGRQINDPNEAIVSIGDYNAFSFNDGYGDSMGTIRGVPTPPDQAATASADVVSPDLVDVADFSAPDERYSYLFNGNAQTLDHVLISANLVPRFDGLAHPRVNADFPEVLRGDATTPSRLSDHDPAVAYFSFPPDVEAPTFDAVSDQVAEATGPDGAVVTFETPAAHDNLDVSVAVTCVPGSGSTFAVGNTGVTCSAQDLAGNYSETSFTVTVEDTTAPVLSLPGDLGAEATSPSGATVTFTADASDAVSTSMVVSCLPASGSTFPLGTTAVTCSVQDLAGNTTAGGFSVTVEDTTAPVLTLPAAVAAEAPTSAGTAVSFNTTATDLVTPAPAVTCTPASGSTFPAGATVVTCTATDTAGNVATGTFTVTVSVTPPPDPTTVGHMAGLGEVVNSSQRTWFMFDVREAVRYGERGWVLLQVREGFGPVRYLAASVTDVQFSNNARYAPSRRFARNAVDTVTFSGVGYWNGMANHRFEITASDRGEPGRGLDTFTVKIFAPNGAEVESAGGTLREGNIQSLR